MSAAARRCAAALAAACACACACANQASDDAPPPDDDAGFTLEVSPGDVELALGASLSVTVGVSRAPGFNDAVALSWVGAPPGLSATFADAPVAGDTTTLVLSATEALPVQAFTAWIRGDAGDARQVVPLTVRLVPGPVFRVSGRVSDAWGEPLRDASVWHGGVEIRTGADGRFEHPGITAPYTLSVVRAGAGGPELYVFAGLSRPDPELGLINVPGAVPTTEVSGEVSGGAGYPADDEHVTLVALAAARGFGTTAIFPGQGPAYGPLPAVLLDAAPIAATVFALQWRFNAALLPEEYTGFGAADVAATRGTPLAGADVALAPVATAYVSGDVAVPAGYAVESKALWLQLGPLTAAPLVVEATADATFTYAAPSLGLSLGVQVTARDPQDRVSHAYRPGLGASEVVQLEVPAAPELLAPAPAATAVAPGTPFSWTAYEPGVHVLTLVSLGGGPAAAVFTADTTVALPDLGALGLGLSAPADYLWAVWGLGPAADLDALTAPGGAPRIFGLDREVSLAISELRAARLVP